MLTLWGVFRPENDREAEITGWLAILVLAIAGWLVLQAPTAAPTMFDGAFIDDAFGRFMKILALGGSALAILLSFDDFRDNKILKFEYPVLILLATAGMMMMISAGDLISLYLGLELQSLALYVVAAFRRDDVRSSEAGLKYFVLGALSSGMLLYGASLIYGFTGTTRFDEIARIAVGSVPALTNPGIVFGLVFLMVGHRLQDLGRAVPHVDAGRLPGRTDAGRGVLLRSAEGGGHGAARARGRDGILRASRSNWQQIVVFLSIASMLLGAFAAIGQTNIKRLLAYSSIANVGFALVPLVTNSKEGVEGVLIYMAIYIVMTLGAFACVLAMRRESGDGRGDRPARGPRAAQPADGSGACALMFSLAGIPPLAGFWGKFYAFMPAIKSGYYIAGGDRRAGERGRRLLLPAHRQDHVLRRAGGEVPARRGKVGIVMALSALFVRPVRRGAVAVGECGGNGCGIVQVLSCG